MTANGNDTVIMMQNIIKTYRLGSTEVRALRGVDLEIRKGEFTVVMGPSGSGKTTLLNILGCLDVPTSGDYWLHGQRIAETDVDRLAPIRNANIGFVFQNFNLIPVLDTVENIEFPLLLREGHAPRDSRERALALAEAVGLKDFPHHRPDELSGGQRQRVAIARALIMHPQVVLADEPTANLDSETAEQILDLMESINRERGATFLISTHDPRVLKRARRVLIIRDGKVADEQAAAA
ncbi:MAG: putative ABC transporter ATP-binding protein YknY [Myxococcota bacterium]|nr:putative ABC transporter ATP-binding protein YknY [Myxococcota bacterium]